ncbi:MAG: response regulator [Flavisolibacter sp.]|jgi:CheY-like chemotaxis protein|nr:response regulator [Flavisolibacter sp.]
MINKISIAIVDDDADDREIIKDAFAASGKSAECILLENGDALIDFLTSSPASGLPSLIMLDLNMPGKDGREALKDIKSNNLLQTIPIIVFTTSSSSKDKQVVYELGANCFITKPDTFNKLVDLTQSIIKLWLPEA